MKSVYALQPYLVGSRNCKSLAIVIPVQVVKKYGIDTSTIFALKGDDSTRTLTLQTLPKLSGFKKNIRISATSLDGTSQQVSSEGAQ